jgi:hypothetical protein
MNRRIAVVIILTLMILGFVRVAQGQGAEVTGEVYRGTTPIVNCTVSVGEKFGFTDVNGRFRIDNVRAGQYTLVVSRDGKKLREQSVVIGNANTNLPRIIL